MSDNNVSYWTKSRYVARPDHKPSRVWLVGYIKSVLLHARRLQKKIMILVCLLILGLIVVGYLSSLLSSNWAKLATDRQMLKGNSPYVYCGWADRGALGTMFGGLCGLFGWFSCLFRWFSCLFRGFSCLFRCFRGLIWWFSGLFHDWAASSDDSAVSFVDLMVSTATAATLARQQWLVTNMCCICPLQKKIMIMLCLLVLGLIATGYVYNTFF